MSAVCNVLVIYSTNSIHNIWEHKYGDRSTMQGRTHGRRFRNFIRPPQCGHLYYSNMSIWNIRCFKFTFERSIRFLQNMFLVYYFMRCLRLFFSNKSLCTPLLSLFKCNQCEQKFVKEKASVANVHVFCCFVCYLLDLHVFITPLTNLLIQMQLHCLRVCLRARILVSVLRWL